MTDLNESTSDLTDNDVGNTDTQGHFTDADIDAINAAWAEAESIVAENATVEQETELSGNSEQLQDEPVGKIDRLEEPEPQPEPWDNAPADCYFYEKIYPDGHLGKYIESAETAFKMGWDIEHNYIPIADVKESDVNGLTYPKELCPMKTPDDISKDKARERIAELKKFLSATDYKAIKYAEGALTPEEYDQDRQARADARTEINNLEDAIK